MGDGWAAEREWERLCFGRELLEVWVEAMVCVLSLQAEIHEKRERVLGLRGRNIKVLEENIVSKR